MNNLGLQLLYFFIISFAAYASYLNQDFRKIKWITACQVCFRFIICAVFLLSLVRSELISHIKIGGLLNFIPVTLIWFISPKLVYRLGEYPKSTIDDQRNSRRIMLSFDFKLVTIKYFEIIFQQAGFFYLMFGVFEIYSMQSALLWFTIIISLLHLGNLLFLSIRRTLFYFILSIPMGFFFGFLIRQEFILITISIHLIFYLIYNGYPWIKEKYRGFEARQPRGLRKLH